MARASDLEKLFNTMLQFGKLMSQSTQETHEERTATMLQFSALHFLKDQPNDTVTNLATSLKLSKSSATQLIERLVKLSLVKRTHDSEDRRVIRLNITEKGKKECIILKRQMIQKMQKFFSKIPAKDLKELVRIHTNLVKTLRNEQK